MGCEQQLREHVVREPDRDEREHDCLIDSAPDALGALRHLQSLVAAEQRREQEEKDTRAKVDAIVTGCTRGLSNE